MEPTVLVIGGENASLGALPPFLHEGEGVVGGGNDVFQAVWANWIACVFCGGIRGVVVREGRKKIRQGRLVMGEKSDGSCVKSKLNSSANLRRGGMVSEGNGLKCLPG